MKAWVYPAGEPHWFCLRFHYSAGAVAALKDAVPSVDRRYDPGSRTWTVWGSYRARVRELLRRRGYEVHEEREEALTTSVEPWASLYLIPGAPRPVVEAAYRALAKTVHPDVGGNHEAMQRVNVAYSALREQSDG